MSNRVLTEPVEKRVIKFRAWDKNAVMMKDDGTHPNGKPHMKYDVGIMASHARNEWAAGIDGLEIRIDSTAFNLMQFTGLHDKNGKEIYEGDILKYILLGDESDEQDIEYTEPVSFVDGCFNVEGNTPVYATVDWDCEIIGNIYQNPELL